MAIDKTPLIAEQFKSIPTINEFAEFFMQNYVMVRNKLSEQDKKRQILDNFILPIFGGMRLNEITAAHIDIFVSRMRVTKVSPKTINNRVAVLGKMLRYAYARQLIDKVPPIEMLKGTSKEMRFLKADEVGRLLAAAQADIDVEWWAMIVVGLHTGMRNGELRALKWEDIDRKRQVVHVQRSMYIRHEQTPKSLKSNRRIPLNEPAIAALGKIKRTGPFVFGRPPHGTVPSYWASKDVLEKVCRIANLKRVGWHTLRHTFASHLVMAGTPIRVVQDLLGHGTIQMTMRYSHLEPQTKSTAVDILTNIFKP